MSWKEYKKAAKSGAPLMLPVGSVEQHGFHLPLLTDTILSTKLCEKIAPEINAYIAESWVYGTRSDLYSGGGENYPGTISLEPKTVINISHGVLNEFVIDGFKKFIILNGHFENAHLLRESCRKITTSNRDVRIIFLNWWDFLDTNILEKFYPRPFPGMDLEHSGVLETSLMMYLSPEYVNHECINKESFPRKKAKKPGFEIYPEKLSLNISASGCLSSPQGSNDRIGQIIYESVLKGIKAALPNLFHGENL